MLTVYSVLTHFN